MKANSLDVLGGVADRLGQIKAQLADLKKEEAELKDTLIDSGLAVVWPWSKVRFTGLRCPNAKARFW
jgi:hypothetical protein